MQKDYLTIFATVVTVVMLALVITYCSITLYPTEASQSTNNVLPTIHEEQLIKLDREAVNSAYKHHVEHLFLTWMKDPTGQPARARKGAIAGRKAYSDIITEIEKREHYLGIGK